MKSIFEAFLQEVEIPHFYEIRQDIDQPEVADIEGALYQGLEQMETLSRIQAGQSVAITAGSREVPGFNNVILALGSAIRKRGGIPFIVPAMGSHGGATAEGQLAVLSHYGITEESVGMPIRSCMETVKIGEAQGGLSVRIDKIASEADWIIPVAKVKPHSDFRGEVESGIMKMLAIGLGKQYGASICHKHGFINMGRNVRDFGRTIISNANIAFAVALIENAEHKLAYLEVVPTASIDSREPILLEEAKRITPKIPFDNLDLLIVNEMGKEISGAGMDPNVTGRSAYLDKASPNAQKIVVLDLTDKSDGNAAGMGNADVISKRMYDKIDFEPIYVNAITCRDTLGSRLPMVMPNDKLAIQAGIYTCCSTDESKDYRIAWIKNTSSLSRIFISSVLLEEALAICGLQVGDKKAVVFDECGNILPDQGAGFHS